MECLRDPRFFSWRFCSEPGQAEFGLYFLSSKWVILLMDKFVTVNILRDLSDQLVQSFVQVLTFMQWCRFFAVVHHCSCLFHFYFAQLIVKYIKFNWAKFNSFGSFNHYSGIYNTNPLCWVGPGEIRRRLLRRDQWYLWWKSCLNIRHFFRDVRCLWFDFYELKKGQDVVKMFEKS